MRKLDRKEMFDLLTGCALFGTGGGGEFDAGMRYIDAAIAADKEFKLAPLSELSDHDLVCSPYALGCTVPSPRPEHQQHLPTSDRPPILLAMEALANQCKQRFSGTVSCELGAENTAVAAYASAMMDGYLVDGDAAGRAVPEITHSTFYLNKLPVSPMAMANQFGETVICDNVFNDQRAEEIAREFAKISCDDIAAVDHPLRIAQLRGAIIERTLSSALEIGQLINDDTIHIDEVCRQILSMCNGKLLFRGIVAAVDVSIQDGFTVGTIGIEGTDRFANNNCSVELKNENMLARINQEIVATIPDLICIIDRESRKPVTNPNAQSGNMLTVMILPAPKVFTTAAGLEIFGPKYLGIDKKFSPHCDQSKPNLLKEL